MSWDQCQPIGIEILNTCIKLKHYPSNSGLPCLFLAGALALAHARLQSAQTFAPTQPCQYRLDTLRRRHQGLTCVSLYELIVFK